MQGYTTIIKKGELLHKTMERKVGKGATTQNLSRLSSLTGLTPAYVEQAIRTFLFSCRKK
jgi:hypothetical protein